MTANVDVQRAPKAIRWNKGLGSWFVLAMLEFIIVASAVVQTSINSPEFSVAQSKESNCKNSKANCSNPGQAFAFSNRGHTEQYQCRWQAQKPQAEQAVFSKCTQAIRS